MNFQHSAFSSILCKPHNNTRNGSLYEYYCHEKFGFLLYVLIRYNCSSVEISERAGVAIEFRNSLSTSSRGFRCLHLCVFDRSWKPTSVKINFIIRDKILILTIEHAIENSKFQWCEGSYIGLKPNFWSNISLFFIYPGGFDTSGSHY